MIVKSKWIPKGYDAYTVWPFILIKPEYADNAALIAHEMVHYKEQRRMLVLPWLLMNLFSRSFRLKSEIRGYKAQIALGGITPQEAAVLISTKYDLDVSYSYALFLLLTEGV